MKQKFDLSLWLQDKSRKVMTRTGESVEIVLTDWGDPFPILGRIGNSGDPIIWLSDGRSDMDAKLHDNDLFFADEEEELTEFEKAISEFIQKLTFNGNILPSKDIKGYAKSLLDLARKELQPDIDKELDEAYKTRDEVVYLEGYDRGKQDALKDLPKWKKATKNKEFDKHVLLFQDEESVVLTTELYKGEYYIEEDDLKTLPKED